MAEPILCPNCRTALRMPANFKLTWLTCPRCLAVVQNPLEEAVTPEPPAPPRVTSGSGAGPVVTHEEPRLCPTCRKPTQRRWMFCPYCETALRGPDGTTVDVLIRGDSRRTGVGVIFLAVLGGIGLALALVSAAREAVGGNARPLVAVLIIFAVFFVATALLALSRSRKDERAPGIGRLLFNTMSLVGGTMAICVAAALGLGILMLTLCMAASRC